MIVATVMGRVAQLPARPVFSVLNAAGAVAGIASPFVGPLDPHHRFVAGASPTSIVVIVGGAWAWRLARALLRRGAPP